MVYLPPNRSFLLKRLLPAIAIVVFVALTQVACSSLSDSKLEFWRVMPIQIARVSQTDSYRQTYILDNTVNTVSSETSLEKRQLLDARMDEIFNIMLGDKNWQHLKNLYGVSSIRDELIDKKIHMEGLVNFIAYLDPDNFRYVIIEGTGRFFAVRDKTSEILLSGDFHIAPQRYKIKDIQSGCIPVETNIFITRIPGKPTYYKNAVIQYDLLFQKDKNDKKVFSINYDQEHMAYIDLNEDGIYDHSELFAALKFNGRYHHAKLIDLNGLEFIKEDYDAGTRAELEASVAAQEDKQRLCAKDTPKEP